jgi:hypothetical protein
MKWPQTLLPRIPRSAARDVGHALHVDGHVHPLHVEGPRREVREGRLLLRGLPAEADDELAQS